MNDRIKQLADAAGLIQEHDGDVYLLEHATGELEKFAELIVKECMEVIEDSEGYSQYFHHVTENIEKHFGVEE